VLDGTLNVFEEIDEYIELRNKMEKQNPRFFLQASRRNPILLQLTEFFNDQPIGVSSFRNLVKNVCIAENVRGNGVHDYVTNHRLRGTMTSLLLDAGFSDTTVSMRTGHRNNDSLKSYKNNQGGASYSQQKALFETTHFELQHTPKVYRDENASSSMKKEETNLELPRKKRVKTETNTEDAEDLI